MTEPTFNEPIARETSQLGLILLLNGMTYQKFLELGEAGQRILAASGQMDEAQLKIAMRQIHLLLEVRLAMMRKAIIENVDPGTAH